MLHDSCPKIIKIPKFLWYLPEKITKFPEFYVIFALKMPKFYIIIAGKIFFPIMGGRGTCPSSPHLLRLCTLVSYQADALLDQDCSTTPDTRHVVAGTDSEMHTPLQTDKYDITRYCKMQSSYHYYHKNTRYATLLQTTIWLAIQLTEVQQKLFQSTFSQKDDKTIKKVHSSKKDYYKWLP